MMLTPKPTVFDRCVLPLAVVGWIASAFLAHRLLAGGRPSASLPIVTFCFWSLSLALHKSKVLSWQTMAFACLSVVLFTVVLALAAFHGLG